MKLIIVGGTGMVATELIRQSLAMPEITSVVTVARKDVKLHENAVQKANFKSLLIKDYEEYPDTLKAESAGAAACIWQVPSSIIFCFYVANIIHRTVAIMPFRLSKFEFAEVKCVCQSQTRVPNLCGRWPESNLRSQSHLLKPQPDEIHLHERRGDAARLDQEALLDERLPDHASKSS